MNRLRAKGGEVWYLLAADEGHGYRKKQNRDAYYETFAQFLMTLRNDASLGALGVRRLLAFGGRCRQRRGLIGEVLGGDSDVLIAGQAAAPCRP